MARDPVDELVAFARDMRQERELSATWEDVVRGTRGPPDVPRAEHDRALFQPLDATTRAHLVSLVCAEAPQLCVSPSLTRRWVRPVTGIAALAAAAGLALYVGTATTRQDSVEYSVLPPPEFNLLGGHTSTRTGSDVPPMVDRYGTQQVYEVAEGHEFRIEARTPRKLLLLRRVVAHCGPRDVELRFTAPVVTPGLTAAKVTQEITPGEVCQLDLTFEINGETHRFPPSATPRIQIVETP